VYGERFLSNHSRHIFGRWLECRCFAIMIADSYYSAHAFKCPSSKRCQSDEIVVNFSPTRLQIHNTSNM